MLIHLKHKNDIYSAYFRSTVNQNENDYGSGIYLDIRRNGNEFKYVDCRYMLNFNEEKVLKEVLNDYFGDNILELKVVKE